MQSIPNPSWVYNITVCSTYGTGFALKLLRVRSLLVVDYQIIIILSSYHSKSPVNAMLGVLITPTSSTVLLLPWLQNSCGAPHTPTVLYYACVAAKFLLESLLIVHSISHVFVHSSKPRLSVDVSWRHRMRVGGPEFSNARVMHRLRIDSLDQLFQQSGKTEACSRRA